MDNYTKLIRDTADELGQSRRKMAYEWEKARQEVLMQQMQDPDKYGGLSNSFINKSLGDDANDLSEIIGKQFLNNVKEQNPESETDENIESATDEMHNDLEGTLEQVDLNAEQNAPMDTDTMSDSDSSMETEGLFDDSLDIDSEDSLDDMFSEDIGEEITEDKEKSEDVDPSDDDIISD